MERLLRRMAVATQTARRGDVALQMIETEPYDAIVLDLMLPGMTGIEILRRLRATHPQILRRIVVLTALSGVALKDFEFHELVWRVIQKPFDIREFLDVVLGCAASRVHVKEGTGDDLEEWFARRSAVLGARAGVIGMAHERSLHLRAKFGYEPGVAEAVFPLSLERNVPLCAAVRTMTPVWLVSLRLATAQYPLLLSIWTANGNQAIAALPLLRGKIAIGAVGWGFDQPQAFDESSRPNFLGAAAECCARVGISDDEGCRRPARGVTAITRHRAQGHPRNFLLMV